VGEKERHLRAQKRNSGGGRKQSKKKPKNWRTCRYNGGGRDQNRTKFDNRRNLTRDRKKVYYKRRKMTKEKGGGAGRKDLTGPIRGGNLDMDSRKRGSKKTPGKMKDIKFKRSK